MAHKDTGAHSKKHKNSNTSGELIIDHSSETAKKPESTTKPESITVEAAPKPHEAVTHGYLASEKSHTHHAEDHEQVLATNKVKDVEPPQSTYVENRHPDNETPSVVVPGGVSQDTPNPASFFRSKYRRRSQPQQSTNNGIFGIMPEVSPEPQYGAVSRPHSSSSSTNKNRKVIASFIAAFVIVTILTVIFGIYLPGRNRAVDNPNNVYELTNPENIDAAPSTTVPSDGSEPVQEPDPSTSDSSI